MENTLPHHETNSATDRLGEKLGRIKTDIQEVVGLARSLAGEKISGYTTSAVKGGKAAMDNVTEYIEERPLRSALVAVGIGAVVGFLLSRRL